MNTHIIGIVIALFLSLACILGLSAKNNDHVSQTRKVAPFTAIKIASVATVHFTQGDKFSLRIEGRERFVRETTTEVKGGTLVIGLKDADSMKKYTNSKRNGVRIYLTAPSLEKVTFTGVGGFRCEETLRADDIRFDMDGVGSLKIADLRCDRLDLNIDGVGSADIHFRADHADVDIDGVGTATLSGEARTATVSRSGIGRVNTKGLKVDEGLVLDD